jgi:hypothetical protein
VTTTVLDDGRELESAMVVVGVGARPNTQLLQGQVDVEDQKPGGIPVSRNFCRPHSRITMTQVTSDTINSSALAAAQGAVNGGDVMLAAGSP